MTQSTLQAFLDPRSVAIIGASENPNKIGGRPLAYMIRFGFRGTIYPINPKREEVQGQRCWPDLAALPEVPEMAVIAVPGDAAVEAVEACALAGVKAAVVMTSGFGETSSPEGRAKERRMVEAARRAGMRMVGPNSQGLANFATGAVPNFSTMFIEQEPADGPIAIVSQSGAMSVVPYGLLRRRGLGVRHAHATGNDADVTVAELAGAVAADPGVELLLLYLESIPDPRPLIETARIARERGLPVLALKSGRTQAGQIAARSHTGALANEDRVVDAFLEHLGIWRAPDIAGLVDAAELYLKGWKPRGRRLVAISNSGATCVMAADAASAAGMPMAELKPSTREAMGAVLPTFATTTNPIDLTAALLTNSRLFNDILPILADDPAADAFLVGITVAGAGYDVEGFARDTAGFALATGKPVVAAIPQPNVAAPFKALGVPTFELETQAVAALHQFVGHHELMRRRNGRPLPTGVPAQGQDGVGRTLNEADSLALLYAHGVPVVPHRLCTTETEAVAAAAALGPSVAVKGCSADIPHKSEMGLVRLNLRDPAIVAQAFRDMVAIMTRAGKANDGVLVAAMRGGLELMIGAHRDPVFGAVVAIGAGGKYVEAMPDVQLLLPPFDAADVRAALQRLRIAPLLPGVRGDAPRDVTAFCDAAVAVGYLMQRPDVLSLDLNPVMVGADGEGVHVVDALTLVR